MWRWKMGISRLERDASFSITMLLLVYMKRGECQTLVNVFALFFHKANGSKAKVPPGRHGGRTGQLQGSEALPAGKAAGRRWRRALVFAVCRKKQPGAGKTVSWQQGVCRHKESPCPGRGLAEVSSRSRSRGKASAWPRTGRPAGRSALLPRRGGRPGRCPCP